MKKLVFMNLRIPLKIGIVFVCMLFLNCSGSEYSKLVQREIAKGVVYDSLLFDMKFGQKKQDFFRTCWKLNQDGIVTQGPGNESVKYTLPLKENASTESSITLLFFGDFNDEKIMTGMDLQFYYNAWSIWNKKMQSEQLMPVVIDSLKKWFPGNDFMKVPLDKKSQELFVKVDGNRRITVGPINDNKIVKAKIDDLRYVLQKD